MRGFYDLAVVGGGILGLAHALAAVRAGKRVVVIERDFRAIGASIRNFGFVTVTGQEGGLSWRLARRTRDLWAEVASAANIPIHQHGLHLTAHSPEAVAVIKAFQQTEMGKGCALLTPARFHAEVPGIDGAGIGGEDLAGVLHSPHELRVESREAIPALTRWLAEAHGVTFLQQTAVTAATPPRLQTSRGVVEAGAIVVCPGDDYSTLYPERIATHRLGRCRLTMLKLADPGYRLPATLMSDLSLVRYRGYAALPEARSLEARLRAEQPRHFANGVHLIVAQGADGGLIVGDSHHYGDLPGPFAPATAEEDILDEFARATGHPPPPVIERWTGTYSVPANPEDARTFLVDTPEPGVRLVIVTSGTGASTGFAIAEMVVADLLGLSAARAA